MLEGTVVFEISENFNVESLRGFLNRFGKVGIFVSEQAPFEWLPIEDASADGSVSGGNAILYFRRNRLVWEFDSTTITTGRLLTSAANFFRLLSIAASLCTHRFANIWASGGNLGFDADLRNPRCLEKCAAYWAGETNPLPGFFKINEIAVAADAISRLPITATVESAQTETAELFGSLVQGWQRCRDEGNREASDMVQKTLSKLRTSYVE
ncbi:MAG: hypothetical protein DLM73_00070 [Chthoniobacterales bacterium]|nr:MAG: hypothetical protein DLM73_00070 [Chthoniobacterales bacterium]